MVVPNAKNEGYAHAGKPSTCRQTQNETVIMQKDLCLYNVCDGVLMTGSACIIHDTPARAHPT